LFEDISSTTSAVDLNLDHVRVIDLASSSDSSGLTLPAGAGVSFTARFKPTRAGTRSAKFRLMKDGDSDDVFNFNLLADGSVSYDEWLALKNDASPAVGGGSVNPLLDFAFGFGPDEVPGSTLAYTDGKIVSRGKPTVIAPAASGGGFRGVFVRRKDHQAAGLRYHPQFSSDLARWHDAAGVPVILAEGGGVEIASLTAPDTLDGKPARFFRVGVSHVAAPSGRNFADWLEYYDIADLSSGTGGTQANASVLMDYAFGLPPGGGAAGLVSEINGLIASRGRPNALPPATPGDTFKGLYARRKNHADAGLEYRPQFSADLIHWHDAPDGRTVVADDGEIQVLSVSAPALPDGRPARFFRVGILLKPES
jgi:hypothetical protein